MERLLASLQHLASFSDADGQALLSLCRWVSVAKGEDLQPIGHTCRTLYFVVEGGLRTYYYKDGKDISERFEFEGSFVARAESLFSGRPSRKGLQALEDSRLLAISALPLFALYDGHHGLERAFRRLFEQAYVQAVQRLEELQFHTAEERYQLLLHDHPDLLQRVPLKHVASYLGITQVSLSRIRSKRP